MNRKQFISLLTMGAATAVVSTSLVSCAKNNNLAPTNVDFTLDLNNSAYAPLKTNGGSIAKDGVIIARTSGGAFLAYSQYCTHQGYPVNYDSQNNVFYCNAHGSVFNSNGNPVQGPAPSPLTKYSTQLTGTSLRVYS